VIETLTAWLPSYGYDDRRPTKHTFSHRQPMLALVDRGGALLQPDALMYRCAETGVCRQWGADFSRCVMREED
jgi:hypothetical protein